MTKSSAPSPTRIYLLTVWYEQSKPDSAQRTPRFSLEDPHTGERQAFNSPQALAEFFAAGLDGQDG